MKKALVVLLAMTCLAAAAFAADTPSVAINVFVDTGAAALLPGDASSNPVVKQNQIQQYNNDSGNAGRFRLGIAITAPDGTFGFISRMEGDSGLVGNAGNNSSAGAWSMGFNRFLGWANVLNNMLTLKAGILDESLFWTANRNWGGWLDGAFGIEVMVKPMPGLAISYYLPAAPIGQVGGVLPWGPVSYTGNGSLQDTLSGSSIQAAYSMANTVNIVAGFQGAHANALAGSPVQDQTGYIWAGVDVTAIPNVTARIEAQMKNLGNTAVSLNNAGGENDIFLEGAYVMGPAKFDVAIWVYLYAVSNSDMGWDVEPNVSYDLGVAKVGIVGDIGNIGGIYSGPLNSVAVYDVRAGEGVQNTKLNADIGPYIGVPIGAGTSVNAGLLYTIGSLSGTTGTSNGAAIYVDFRWSF
jgi:hypothetical protein